MAVQGEKNPVVVGGLYRREQLTTAASPKSAVCTEQTDVVLGRTCGKRLLKPSVFKSWDVLETTIAPPVQEHAQPKPARK